jgi:phosphonate transport system substrate-binding protein
MQTVVTLLGCILLLQVQASEFVFTAIPDQDETRLRERFAKVADYLADELDTDVRYLPVKSYPAAIAAFQNNQVQLAWFGGLSGVQVRRLVPGSMALAQGYEDQSFRTYFIANTGTGLQESSEFPTQGLAGINFTFGSKGSTSGRLMPEYHIRLHSESAPDDLFNKTGFSGNHSRTIRLVESGAYDAGAVNFQVWESELSAGRVDTEKVRVIWRTPPYPDYQWTIRGDIESEFGAGFIERVRQALLDMDDPELLESFSRSSFVIAENDDYAVIEGIAMEIGLLE